MKLFIVKFRIKTKLRASRMCSTRKQNRTGGVNSEVQKSHNKEQSGVLKALRVCFTETRCRQTISILHSTPWRGAAGLWRGDRVRGGVTQGEGWVDDNLRQPVWQRRTTGVVLRSWRRDTCGWTTQWRLGGKEVTWYIPPTPNVLYGFSIEVQFSHGCGESKFRKFCSEEKFTGKLVCFFDWSQRVFSSSNSWFNPWEPSQKPSCNTLSTLKNCYMKMISHLFCKK